MILCTGCGTRNEDAAHVCAKCGRKLQSRWAAPAANGNGAGQASGPSRLGEPVWHALEPVLRGFDESASALVKACAETWAYGLLLIVCVVLTAFTENWWFLAGGVVVAGGLAWLRGV